MSGSVTAKAAERDSSVESQIHELPPGPKSEVVTVAFLQSLKVFRRLPIVIFVEELFVGNLLTPTEEVTDFVDGLAVDRKGLADVSAERKSWSYPFATVKWAEDFLADSIVCARDSLRDHEAYQVSRTGRNCSELAPGAIT